MSKDPYKPGDNCEVGVELENVEETIDAAFEALQTKNHDEMIKQVERLPRETVNGMAFGQTLARYYEEYMPSALQHLVEQARAGNAIARDFIRDLLSRLPQ